MSPRSTLIASAVAVLLTASVWHLTTSAPVPPPGRPTIVDRLASADPAERSKAEDELGRLSPDGAMAVVWDLERRGDRRSAAAAARVRDALERQRIALARKGSRVRRDWFVDPPNPLSAVFGTFQTQTDNRFALIPEQEGRPVEFDAADAAFWPAVDDVASQAGLALGGAGPAGRYDELVFRDRLPADDAVRVGYSGSVRLAAGPLTKRPGGLRVPLEVRVEPRLTPLSLDFGPSDLWLATEDGLRFPLRPAGTDRPAGPRFGIARKAVDVELDFAVPADPGRGPYRLGGRLTVTVAADFETFQLPLAQRHRAHGRRMNAELAVARIDGDAVECEVVFAGRHASASVQNAHDGELVYPVHGNGGFWHDKSLPATDRPVVRPTADGVAVRYRFSGVPASETFLSLHCRLATEVIELPLEVSIDVMTVAE